jgi:hypothetical protein
MGKVNHEKFSVCVIINGILRGFMPLTASVTKHCKIRQMLSTV